MRNLTGSQCNRFRIGTERLNRGALVTILARQFWTHCNLAISFSGILWNFEFDAGHGYDRSMPYMFGICVFWKFRLLSNSTPRFLADVDGFVSWLRSKHGKLFKNFSRWSLVPIRRNSVLPGLSFSLDPVIQADTPIKQCCNFSRDSLAFKTDRDM